MTNYITKFEGKNYFDPKFSGLVKISGLENCFKNSSWSQKFSKAKLGNFNQYKLLSFCEFKEGIAFGFFPPY